MKRSLYFSKCSLYIVTKINEYLNFGFYISIFTYINTRYGYISCFRYMFNQIGVLKND